jgi:uncharacterized membrane protein
VVTAAFAIVLRFLALSHLWLDEALSVNIAKLPVGDIPAALRHDGAPPFYYLLLHFWMDVFGSSPAAVRALSGLISVASLPLMYLAGRRLGGRAVGVAAMLLLAASPFAIRQGTESRMYSLVSALVLVGFLVLGDLLREWSWPRGVLLTVVSALLMLTHYWSIYLLAATAIFLAWRAWKGPAPREAAKALGAVVAGGVLFLPWLPSFLYQAAHTGTPWAVPATPMWIFDTVFQFVDGHGDYGIVLGLAFYGLIALAIFGKAVDARHIDFDFRGRQPGRLIGSIAFGALALGVAAAMISRSAYAPRYASIVLPLILLLVAIGANVFADTRVRTAVVAICVVIGMIGVAPEAFDERTAAANVASALQAKAHPGDVVAYCPDQLGPSVSLLLGNTDLTQVTFPAATPPQRIDWVGYTARNKAGKTLPFAEMLAAMAGPTHDVWLVWAPGYRTYKTKCQALSSDLEKVRPAITRVVKLNSDYFEKAALVRYQP